MGEQGSTWSYGHVVLSKITNGAYYSGSIDLGGEYDISQDNGPESYSWISPDINNRLVKGEGNTNYLARWIGADRLGTGIAYDNGTNLGIGLTSPQKRLDVLSNSNDFVTVAANTLSVGEWTGIHFGYRENNLNYRKSAIVFQRTDTSGGGGNAAGKIHFLNGPEIGGGSATLADSKVTIGETGNLGIGTTGPTQKLDVNGNIRMRTGALAGRIPISAADGTMIWTDPNAVIPATVTASNGLTKSANNIKLGGALSESSVITQGNHKMTFNLNGTGDFEIQDNGSSALFVSDGGNTGLGTNAPETKLDVNGGILRTSTRVSSAQKYPVSHSTGDDLIGIDPTWADEELQAFFNSSKVAWENDATAPAGWSIKITGSTSVGGPYSSGFPYIPVEDGAVYYMECWIKSASGTNGHYMGSTDYNESFTSLGGNPGSYGYWTMSNTMVGTGWVKVTGTITGFGTSTGQFKVGTKYWTPLALFNYTGGGTSYISGWKVTKSSNSGASGYWTRNGSSLHNINLGDNVGIGMNNPSYKLHVAGRLKTNGINETSDERLKKDIMSIHGALDNVLQMKGVTYNWRKTEYPNMGLEDGLQ